jgi:hypothetical protein
MLQNQKTAELYFVTGTSVGCLGWFVRNDATVFLNRENIARNQQHLIYPIENVAESPTEKASIFQLLFTILFENSEFSDL